MARIVYGNGISSLSGKVGGTVYSHGLSGAVMKSTPIKRNNSSVHSQYNRLTLSALNQIWSAMSPAARTLWNDYSLFKLVPQKNNPGRFLNGQQIFILYNYARVTVQGAAELVPAFDTSAPALVTADITNTAGVLTVDTSAAVNELIQFLMFRISGRMRPGRKAAPGGLKFIQLVFANSTSCDITTAYELLYGAVPASGDYVEIEYQIFQTSAPNWSTKTRLVTEVL